MNQNGIQKCSTNPQEEKKPTKQNKQTNKNGKQRIK